MSATNDKRLNQIHSKFQTPKNVIAEVLRAKLSEILLEMTRIVAGEHNEVYSLKTNQGRYIIRIDRQNNNSFEKENQAKDLAVKQGVPVAKVLAIDFLEFDGNKLQYSLEEFVEGRIYDLYATDKNILEPIFEQAGEILGRLHEVKFSLCGSSDDDLPGTNYSFEQFIKSSTLANSEYFDQVAVKHNLNRSFVNKLLRLLEENLSVFADEPLVLAHGDFNHKHFVVDQNLQIQAILDWGECSSSSGIKDFGGWYFWFNEIFPVEVLTRKYGNQDYFKHNFQLKLDLYALIKALDLIYYFDEINDYDSFADISRQLGECKPNILKGDYRLT